MKKIWFLFVVSVALAAGAFAADLSVDAKIDLSSPVPGSSYFSFRGNLISVDKAGVDPAKLDALSGASLPADTTERWNMYRPDVKGRSTLPGGFQSLMKYALAAAPQFGADLPKAWKNADGSITIQYHHRGTAFKFTTDKEGKLSFPVGDFKMRKIGNGPPEGQIQCVISKDFSADGTVAGIDWAKVWNPAIPDGTTIAAGNSGKTGKITDDKGSSLLYLFAGTIQVTLTGTVVTVKGDLNAAPVW
ncbi:MAG: hypothetical protein WCL50_03825 [Spirochaetota bacterium]